jgi:hypothetical protein
MNKRVDVVLILWNPDVIELVSFVLHHRNLTSCGVEPSQGAQRIEELIASCSPSVVLFDLDPPYDRSAGAALNLMRRFPNRPFVVTCADPALALKSAPWLSRHPMFQKPYEPDEIADTVRSIARRATKVAAAPVAAMAMQHGGRGV